VLERSQRTQVRTRNADELETSNTDRCFQKWPKKDYSGNHHSQSGGKSEEVWEAQSWWV